MELIQEKGGGTRLVFSESRNGISMRVDNQWKYARRFPGFEAVWVRTDDGLKVQDIFEELYDLRTDYLEHHSLVDEESTKLGELRKMFDDFVPGPVWVYRAVLPESLEVSGEIVVDEVPMILGAIGDAEALLDGNKIRFSSVGDGGGEVYWIPPASGGGDIVQEPVINGAEVRWGPYALSSQDLDFADWSGMVLSKVIPHAGVVWFQKNSLEMWVANSSGREPIVGGVREILQDWGYIQ